MSGRRRRATPLNGCSIQQAYEAALELVRAADQVSWLARCGSTKSRLLTADGQSLGRRRLGDALCEVVPVVRSRFEHALDVAEACFVESVSAAFRAAHAEPVKFADRLAPSYCAIVRAIAAETKVAIFPLHKLATQKKRSFADVFEWHSPSLRWPVFELEPIETLLEFEYLAAAKAAAEADKPAKAKKPLLKRDAKMEARDKLIYELRCDGEPWKLIQSKVNSAAESEQWELIGSHTGLRLAATAYAKRHKLQPLPRRS